MNRYPLRLKLLILSGVVLISACAVLGIFFFYQIKNIMLDNFIKQGYMLAKNLAHNSRYGVFTEDNVLLEELTVGVLQIEEVVNVSILNSEGKLLIQKNILGADYHRLNGIIPTVHWKKVIDSGTPVNEFLRSKDGEEFCYIYVPVTSSWIKTTSVTELLSEEGNLTKSRNSGLTKLGVIQIGLSTAPLKQNIYRAMLIVTGLTIIIMGGSAFLIYYLSRAYFKPLETLSSVAQKVAHGDLSHSAPQGCHGEIGEITNAFNFMIGSLKQRDQQCNDYVSQLNNLNKELTYLNQSLKRLEIENTIE
ncbi:MAG: HAMP domain-containing protein [Nitrospira sp.]|nr:HAMP domain-containing protein [Nitrospira sp.]